MSAVAAPAPRVEEAEEGPRLHDFSKNHSTSSCEIIIGNERLYVSSEILSMHSHFFRSLFFEPKASNSTANGDAENESEDDSAPALTRTSMREVRLDGVTKQDFVDLLNIIYPSDLPITDVNVKSILALADKYHFNVVIHEAENFLKQESKLAMEDRLDLADKYRLATLADNIISGLKDEEIKKLMRDGALSDRTARKLTKRLIG